MSLRDAATAAGCRLGDAREGAREVSSVAGLADAGPDDVTFLEHARYLDALAESRAGACILRATMADRAPPGMAVLISEAPYRSYAALARALHPATPVPTGRHPAATIDRTAELGDDVAVDARAVIGPGASIGRRTYIAPGAVVGAGVVVGEDCVIGPGASLEICYLGDRVRVHTGARVGQRGFGFDSAAFPYTDVPQLGRVIVEDDVEIGANTTIDRGSASDTIIGAGCRLDNLVQIGHNVRLGRGCILVAQAGIAGSTVLADHVVVAGQAGIAGHLHLGEGAQIGAGAGVIRDVAPGERVAGYPAMPVKEFFRLVAILRRMVKQRTDG
jgi:UDP-3-O-[3-hydroxymyristoyl] glucosamine N-acyltransferase